MTVMHRDMEAAPATGNVDDDFAAMMIPHHQGAIDMAKTVLIEGKDPVLRRLYALTQAEIKLVDCAAK